MQGRGCWALNGRGGGGRGGNPGSEGAGPGLEDGASLIQTHAPSIATEIAGKGRGGCAVCVRACVRVSTGSSSGGGGDRSRGRICSHLPAWDFRRRLLT